MDSDRTFGGASNFVTKCKNELKWEDLSKHRVMDVGCGYSFHCSRAILHQFPNVGRLIALDKHPSVIKEMRPFKDELFENKIMSKRVQCCAADIEIRDSLQPYKGSIDKVVSRNVFYQIQNKELAIENIYHLLKPGGDAALLFWLDNPMGTWYSKLMSMEKWSKYITRFAGYWVLSHLYVQLMPEMHIWVKVWGLWQIYKSSGRKSLVLMTVSLGSWT
ncbi:uncharacterized protein NPIL_279171 [Nephila pilipes]|uniref:Methyltransferase domain-containing protein n=1 Tax=Nephila pilipes TaxID=299642 RepID=A0A8X6I6W7_NEPPI|nr:uncharacterized protein NPIL_279171 [Nephila pilipes]